MRYCNINTRGYLAYLQLSSICTRIMRCCNNSLVLLGYILQCMVTQNDVLEKARYLHELGVPITKIADKLGVHRNTVSSWLSGKHRPADWHKETAPTPESSAGHISPLPDTDKHAPSDEGTSIPRRSA